MKNFASYEKEYLGSVTTVRHTVRILLNSSKLEFVKTLELIPDSAVVTMVVDDSKYAGYGEIVFEEQFKSKPSNSSQK